MLTLERIGLYARDEDPRYRVDHLRKLFTRANIELTRLDQDGGSEAPDLILSMGGDGTVLRALTAYPGTPVLAVNFGHVGFLTASPRDALDNVLVRLLSDDYFVVERLTLLVRHRDQTRRCVNEVVVKGTSRMVTLSVAVNGREIHTVKGDGLIVGTPTGSTAYLLSTGAPIVTPDVDCIIVNPLNEYRFSSRPIVMPGSVRITVRIEEASREDHIFLCPDGGEIISVARGDELEIVRSDVPARLLYFEADYFFRNLKGRLGW